MSLSEARKQLDLVEQQIESLRSDLRKKIPEPLVRNFHGYTLPKDLAEFMKKEPKYLFIYTDMLPSIGFRSEVTDMSIEFLETRFYQIEKMADRVKDFVAENRAAEDAQIAHNKEVLAYAEEMLGKLGFTKQTHGSVNAGGRRVTNHMRWPQELTSQMHLSSKADEILKRLDEKMKRIVAEKDALLVKSRKIKKEAEIKEAIANENAKYYSLALKYRSDSVEPEDIWKAVVEAEPAIVSLAAKIISRPGSRDLSVEGLPAKYIEAIQEYNDSLGNRRDIMASILEEPVFVEYMADLELAAKRADKIFYNLAGAWNDY